MSLPPSRSFIKVRQDPRAHLESLQRYERHPNKESPLYCTLIRPQLEYYCSLWSPHTTKDRTLFENVQRHATKSIMNYPHDCCYAPIKVKPSIAWRGGDLINFHSPWVGQFVLPWEGQFDRFQDRWRSNWLEPGNEKKHCKQPEWVQISSFMPADTSCTILTMSR